MEAARRHCRIRRPLLRECLAELVGTTTLVFIGNSCIANNVASPGSPINVPLGYGAALAVSVYATGGVSGGHLNPAVTLALCLTGRCRWNKLLPFTLVQFLGAFIGAALTHALFFDMFKADSAGQLAGVFATYPMTRVLPDGTTFTISTGGGVVDQALGTAVLLYGILAVTDRRNMAVPPALTPLAVGLTLFAVITCSGNNTGAAVNPARDLSPRLYSLAIGYNHAFSAGDHFWWVPVVSTYVGAAVGAMFYMFTIELHHADPDSDADSVSAEAGPEEHRRRPAASGQVRDPPSYKERRGRVNDAYEEMEDRY